jgi:hypothetical protein
MWRVWRGAALEAADVRCVAAVAAALGGLDAASYATFVLGVIRHGLTAVCRADSEAAADALAATDAECETATQRLDAVRAELALATDIESGPEIAAVLVGGMGFGGYLSNTHHHRRRLTARPLLPSLRARWNP